MSAIHEDDVACLFCGKEIGPWRILQDDEFCCSTHRQKYEDRLGKALHQIGAREPAPAGIAPFTELLPPLCGNREYHVAPWCGAVIPASYGGSMPVRAEAVLGSSFFNLVSSPSEPAGQRHDVTDLIASRPPLDMPPFGLAPLDDPADTECEWTPRDICASLMPSPAAEPAAREVRPVSAAVLQPAVPAWILPNLSSVSLTAVAAIAPECWNDPVAGYGAEPVATELSLRDSATARAAAVPPTIPPVFVTGVVSDPALVQVPVPAAFERPIPHQPAVAVLTPGRSGITEALRAASMDARVATPPDVRAPKPPATSARALELRPTPVDMPAADAAGSLHPAPALQIPPPFEPAPANPRPPEAEIIPMRLAGFAGQRSAVCELEMAAGANALRGPDTRQLTPAHDVQVCRAVEPQPVECGDKLPACTPIPVAVPCPLEVPTFKPEPRQRPLAMFGDRWPRAAQPVACVPQDKGARLRFAGGIEPSVAHVPDPGPDAPIIPHPDLIPVEFYCQRAAGSPVRSLELVTPDVALVLPGMPLAIAGGRYDEPAPRPAPKAPAETVPIPMVQKRVPDRRLVLLGQIAACLIVAVSLWTMMRMVSVKVSVAPSDDLMARAGKPAAPAPPSAAAQPAGRMARIRQAIADRAASEISDSMRNGMATWGAPKGAWAPGWSHSTEGYTRVGEMALFRPTMSYTNYRLEFFGQIETKAMGWVVRAQDSQNYYAMKLRVIEAGLRPTIAMVHYPVVGGKRGHAVETPLDVMVHRNTPFRVAVDVKGNRLTASIEGQQVDSWTDDLLDKGGAGFFAEAGERARLYWMKVSRNQDFLGTICSFLAGDSGQQTAALYGAGSPRTPGPAVAFEEHEVAVAEARRFAPQSRS